MIPLRIEANIANGHILRNATNDMLLHQWLMLHEGEHVEVIIRGPKYDKTQPQLGYLHGHVLPQISTHLGYSVEEVYDILKYKFLRVDRDTDKERVLSLRDCDRNTVSKFISSCVDYGLSLGCDIYPPDHYGG